MTEIGQSHPNAAQRDYWNSDEGLTWVEFEDELDQVLQRVNDRLLRLSDPAPDERVLDIGCGTGATARDLAARLNSGGTVLAADISALLLKRARKRGGDVTYVLADAQCHDFGTDRFELVTSRFGTMFFNEPILAFRNIHRSLKRGGRLHMACWRGVAENPWFAIPGKQASKFLGVLRSAWDGAEPGPVAFADADRVVSMLEQAGFDDVSATRETVGLVHPGPLQALARLAARLGPVDRILRMAGGGDEELAVIEARIANAFRRYATPHGVHLPARLNFFAASKR